MTAVEPTLKELAAELRAAYSVVIYAVPLALRMIKAGDPHLEEQRWFWHAIGELSEYVDVLDECDEEDPLDHGLIERRDEVERLSRSEETECL